MQAETRHLPRERSRVIVVASSVVALAAGTAIALDPRLVFGVAIGVLLLLPVVPRWSLVGLAVAATLVVPNMETIGRATIADILIALYLIRTLVSTGTGVFSVGRSKTVPLALFIAWCWLDLFILAEWSTVLSLGRITLYAAAFICLQSESAQDAIRLFRFIALVAVLESLAGLGGVTPRVDGRLWGTYGDPAQTGMLLIAGLAGSVLLARPWSLASVIALLGGIAMTFTRSIWVATAGTLLVVLVPAITRSFIRLAVVVVLLAGTAWMVIPSVTERLGLNVSSVAVRTESWTVGLTRLEDSPWLGEGWGLATSSETFDSLIFGSSVPRSPYNLWINVGASTGVIGVILITWFLISVITSCIADNTRRSRASLAFVVGFIVLSLGEMTIYAAALGTVLFFAIAPLGGARITHDVMTSERASQPVS